MKHTLRILGALMLAVLLALSVTAAPASATGNDDSYVIIYESGGGGDDHTQLNKASGVKSVPTFQNLSAGLWLGCDNVNNNWTNCISSVYIYIKAGTCVQFFDGDNYSSLLTEWTHTGAGHSSGLYTLGSTRNNKYSSMRWGDWVYQAPAGYHCTNFYLYP